MSGGEIEFSNPLIETETGFVKLIVISDYVCLSNPAESKTIKQRLRDLVYSVSHGVEAAAPLTNDLISIRTITKNESWSRAQNLTISRGRKRVGHGTL